MRYIEPFIQADLEKKMVFVGGPRQCGKTFMSKTILERVGGEYLNWDDNLDRRRMQRFEFDPAVPLIVFDELHKHNKWKSWIKGLYDTRRREQSYLVTGSARLDVYRRGGDSLLGRYHYWRMHPFTLDEAVPGISPQEALQRLMTVGGFPEPFLTLTPSEAARWRRERFDRVIKDDIRDLENIKKLAALENLADLLKARVGSQISYTNLAGDLEIAPKTVKHWLELFERMYLVFLVPPYTGKLSRSLHRAQRVYFYDNMDVEMPEDKILGARFENLVATHLLKRLQFEEDYTGTKLKLHYLRDRDNREVDFVIVRAGQVEQLIDVKYSDEEPSKALLYYKDKLKPKRSVQIVCGAQKTRFIQGVEVMSPLTYFEKPAWSS